MSTTVAGREPVSRIPHFVRVRQRYARTGNLRYAVEMDRYLFYEGVVVRGRALDLPLEMCLLCDADVPCETNVPDIMDCVRGVITCTTQDNDFIGMLLTHVLPGVRNTRRRVCQHLCRAQCDAVLHILQCFLLGVYPHCSVTSRRLQSFDVRVTVYAYIWDMRSKSCVDINAFLSKIEGVLTLAVFELVLYLVSTVGVCEFQQIFGVCKESTVADRVLRQCFSVLNGVRTSWVLPTNADAIGLLQLNGIATAVAEKCRRYMKRCVRVHGDGRVNAWRYGVRADRGDTHCPVSEWSRSLFTASYRRPVRPYVRLRDNLPSQSGGRSSTWLVYQSVELAMLTHGISDLKEMLLDVSPDLLAHAPSTFGEDLASVLHAYRQHPRVEDVLALFYIHNTVSVEYLPEVYRQRQLDVWTQLAAVDPFRADVCRYVFLCLPCTAHRRVLSTNTRLSLRNLQRRMCGLCKRQDCVLCVDMIGKCLIVHDRRYVASISVFARISGECATSSGDIAARMEYSNTNRFATDLFQNNGRLRDALCHVSVFNIGLCVLSNESPRPSVCVPVTDVYRLPVWETGLLQTAIDVAALRTTVFNDAPHVAASFLCGMRVRLPRPVELDACLTLRGRHEIPRCIVCYSRNVSVTLHCVDMLFMVIRDISLCPRHSDGVSDVVSDWHTAMYELYHRYRVRT